jgi:hypothetical protein
MAAPIAAPPGPVPRFLSVDERGVGLRASWRRAHGFVNVSLWRDDRCVETFHLSPGEVARLTAFLAASLTEVVSAPVAPHLRSVEPTAVAVPARRIDRLRRAWVAGAARLRRRHGDR